MIYKKKLICYLGALLMFVLFALPTVAADGSTNVSISPLTFDLTANPGDTITNELLVRNSGTDPVVLSIEVQDFVANGEEGEVTLTDEKSTYSLASWVETDTSKFTLAGGKQKSAKFVIRVPYNAEPGGHYASVYVHVGATLDNATSGSGVGQKIGSLLLLKVAGRATSTADIETFKPTKSTFSKGPVDFNIRIKNSGSVHIKPKGVIAITDMFGKKVADVNVSQLNVLPGAIRHMTAIWDKTPAFGKYTATLLAYYGDDNQQLTAVTSFWIVPWVSILVWTLVIVLASVLLWFGRFRIRGALKELLNPRK